MEKASRAIRRSGVKLFSLPGGHGDLNMLLSEIKDIRHSAKLLMNAQHLASQDMMKWAANEENRALQDVISQVAELNLLWTEVQKLFIEHLKEYRHMFEQVLEGEKRVSEARNNLNYCEEKENKVKKEFKRVAKRATSSELRIFESKVSVAEKSREMADLELSERLRENEAIKLIQMKSGMTKISEAYIEMSSKCNLLFSAQKNVVDLLPDVHVQEPENIKYTGAGTTRLIVQQARERLEKYNQGASQDPPPPYTPPEPGSGLSKAVGMVPQPAPRKSGGRDSNSGPAANANIHHDLTELPTNDAKVVHTNKVRIKMADVEDIGCKTSNFSPLPADLDSDPSRDVDPGDDDVDDDFDDDDGSSLYPVLSGYSGATSPHEQDRPVPVPRPRLSNSSDVGKDVTDQNVAVDNILVDSGPVINESESAVDATHADVSESKSIPISSNSGCTTNDQFVEVDKDELEKLKTDGQIEDEIKPASKVIADEINDDVKDMETEMTNKSIDNGGQK